MHWKVKVEEHELMNEVLPSKNIYVIIKTTVTLFKESLKCSLLWLVVAFMSLLYSFSSRMLLSR